MDQAQGNGTTTDNPKQESTDSNVELFDEEGLTEEQIFISRILRGLRKGSRYCDPRNPEPPKTHVPKVLLRSLEEEKRQMSEKMPLKPFTRREYLECTYFQFSTPHAGLIFKGEKTVKMKDYAPKIFADIRRLCGIDSDFYFNGWDFDKKEVTLPSLGPGRSGSLFLMSKNKGFVFKTVPSFEVETLTEILPYLHQYYSEHPESRILRFLGLHRFHNFKGEKVYAIVMNNLLFHPDWGIDVKYDLKGRIPKPGKEGRLASSGTNVEVTRIQDNKLVIKDNDLLDRKFYPKNRDELLQILINDVNFLSSHNCMDYSLLVGIHWIRDEEKSGRRASESGHHRTTSMAMPSPKTRKPSKKKKKRGGSKKREKRTNRKPDSNQGRRRNSTEQLRESAPVLTNGKKTASEPSQNGGEAQLYHVLSSGAARLLAASSPLSTTASKKAKVSHIGSVKPTLPALYLRAVQSDDDHQEMYFIGIIDPLSRYGMRKKVAHLLKRSMWKDQELSTVPAAYYAERYITYLKKIFPEERATSEEIEQVNTTEVRKT